MGRDIYNIYEGTEPYLFISYSHQDNDRVIPIIHGLQMLGYRVWYDTGIGAGTRWPDVIAEHLMNSNCVIAFISENAIVSDYCQEEIFFAMEEHKPLIAVHLEKTQLPPGLRMRLSARHILHRCDSNSDDEFVSKLASENLLQASQMTLFKPLTASFSPVLDHTIYYEKPSGNTVRSNLPFSPFCLTTSKVHPAAEAFLSDYINRYHTMPDSEFIDVVDAAVYLDTFTVNDIRFHTGLNAQTAQAYIQKLQEMRLVTIVDTGTYHITISRDDWNAYKFHIKNEPIKKMRQRKNSRWPL